VEPDAGLGFERLFTAVNRLLAALQYLEEGVLVVALLALAWATGRLVRYVVARRRVLEVTIVGEEPARLPAPEDPDALDRLQEALSIRAGGGPS
jgi:hypothetical protein